MIIIMATGFWKYWENHLLKFKFLTDGLYIVEDRGKILNFPSQTDYDFYTRNISHSLLEQRFIVNETRTTTFELKNVPLSSAPDWPVVTGNKLFQEQEDLYYSYNQHLSESTFLFHDGILFSLPWEYDTKEESTFGFSLEAEDVPSILMVYASSITGDVYEVQVKARGEDRVYASWKYILAEYDFLYEAYIHIDDPTPAGRKILFN